MFAQSIGEEVRKWFKSLPANSINDLPAFDQTFLIDGKSRRILYIFYQSTKILKGREAKVYKVIVLDSIIPIMQYL